MLALLKAPEPIWVVVLPICLNTRMSVFVPDGPVAHDVAVHDTVPLQATEAVMLEWWALAVPPNAGTTTIAPSNTKIAVQIRRICRMMLPLCEADRPPDDRVVFSLTCGVSLLLLAGEATNYSQRISASTCHSP